jgi:hypothetical protein
VVSSQLRLDVALEIFTPHPNQASDLNCGDLSKTHQIIGLRPADLQDFGYLVTRYQGSRFIPGKWFHRISPHLSLGLA